MIDWFVAAFCLLTFAHAAQLAFVSPADSLIGPLSQMAQVSPYLEPATYALTDIKLKTTRRPIWRPRAKGGSPDYWQARMATMRTARHQPHPIDYRPMEWDLVEVEAPDVGDMETLAGLAKMCSNAYLDPKKSINGSKEWNDIPSSWRLSSSFGWTEDGVRGHVFATDNNDTVVVAIKGTSAGGLVGGGGNTQIKDKTNDNLLFSCCCARVDWTWTTVCDCYSGGWKCDQNCVEDALVEKSVYYPLATDLYNNITVMYPNSNIWLTGHSLGGALASLLGLTFGVPVVTFEAPGDLLPAKRLHLPLPPGREANASFAPVTHVYHNADPIPLGACTGSLSFCGLAGFALESRCHTGQTILFDTVHNLGWSVDIRTHGIAQIIEHLLKEDWDSPAARAAPPDYQVSSKKATMQWLHWPGRGKKDDPTGPGENRSETNVPFASAEMECYDCTKWEYGDFK